MSKTLTVFSFLLFSVLGFSQLDKQKVLEAQKAQIQKQIEIFRELLKSEQHKEKSALEQLDNQRAKITLTENLIKTTREQEVLLSEEIRKNEHTLSLLSKELDSLKADYARMIIKSYEMRSEQSRAMFILSSDNFLQAYKRIQYLKQYAQFRKEQGLEVQQKSEVVAEKNKALQKQKIEKEKLVKETEKELANLEQERQKQDKLIALIGKNKKKYTADIKKKQQESAQIDKQIEKLKREAIAEANRKRAEERRKKALAEGKKEIPKTVEVSSTKYDLSPEAQLIADNFKANKGKLPWPVEKGFISSRYGTQPHPIEKHLTINNTGTVFSVPKDSDARAVFEGEVTQIMIITPVNMHVWVQHGDYVTIYGNLDKIYVKKGDKVSLKQKLGHIHTYANGATTIKFTLIQNITTLNPEHWLARN